MKRKLVFCVLCISMILSAGVRVSAAVSEKHSSWAEESLIKAEELKLLPNFFSDSDLTSNISRIDFCHLAYKMLNKKSLMTGNDAKSPFIDTDDNEVTALANAGIKKYCINKKLQHSCRVLQPLFCPIFWGQYKDLFGYYIYWYSAVTNGIVERKDKTKTSSSNRIYPLLSDIKKILISIQRKQAEYKDLFGNCYINSGYVFTRENGEAYFPDYPSKKLQKVIKENQLPHIRWHDLRHSCVCMLIARGWHMKDISEWLGHSDISTTMNIYGHISIEHKREIAKELNGLLEN